MHDIMRTIKLLACVLAIALAAPACNQSSVTLQPGSALPPAPTVAQPDQVLSFSSTTPLALSSAGPVVPLFAIPNIPTDAGTFGLTMWGVKDGSGNILNVTQAA